MAMFWCRTEPIVQNGDDYIRYGMDAESACAGAMIACELHYKYCDITGCNQLTKDEDLLSRKCDLLKEGQLMSF